PASVVLAGVLGTFVDALVREADPAGAPVAPTTRRRKTAPAFDSVHDEWLHALRAPEGLLTAPARDQTSFREQVLTWQRPVTVSTESPFRLCFRLEEPSDRTPGVVIAPSGTWNVRYLLQAQDDASLLLPVVDAWKTRGRTASVFRQRSFNA